MEAAPFPNLIDGSDCESDIATEGDTPSDVAIAAEFSGEEEEEGAGCDFGCHMAPTPNPKTSPFGRKSPTLVLIGPTWHKNLMYFPQMTQLGVRGIT